MNKIVRSYYKYIKNIYIRPFVKISNTECSFRTTISSYCKVTNSVIGRYTSIGRNTTVHNTEIGSFCSISWNVTIGATQHNLNLPSTHAFHYIKGFGFSNKSKRIKVKTYVGHDVWIGANVVIMPGVSIGHGAVIGAGTIVTKNINPYEIHVGNPNRMIKKRFDNNKIDSLLQLKWWNWSKQKIKEKIVFFKVEY